VRGVTKGMTTMSNAESQSRKEKSACAHRWRKVADAVSEHEGGMVVFCELCNETRHLPKPTEECGGKDRRPLLME